MFIFWLCVQDRIYEYTVPYVISTVTRSTTTVVHHSTTVVWPLASGQAVGIVAITGFGSDRASFYSTCLQLTDADAWSLNQPNPRIGTLAFVLLRPSTTL